MREYASDRVDLRSDTVTQPTESMREVMASAEVGDDVMGDDPTVNQLQDRVAKMLGKEAGLYVSSGTMGNAVAILTHTRPGDEIVAYTKSHIFRYEGGGYASLAGCSMSLVPAADGIMKPKVSRNCWKCKVLMKFKNIYINNYFMFSLEITKILKK